MKRVSARTPGYTAGLVALLFCGLAQANIETVSPTPPTATPVGGSIKAVWNELKLDGDKSFNAYIQGNPSLTSAARDEPANTATRPAPSLLWVLGAGIIGLATIARRRSH